VNDGAAFDRDRVRAGCAALVAQLPAIEWITDARVERLSQDFHWFSPVLQRELSHRRADAVARPKTEHEIRAVVAGCARLRLPLTARGSGTGNYGQCVPLFGGVILDLSAFNRLLWMKPGIARAEAGIRLGELDRRIQPQGWELRCVPSTYRSATLGGLFGGGFGGLGSINHGPLASSGNVLGLKAMTVEPEPQTVELRAPEALLLHHVYGTNGLVLELEVGLAPAHPWLEAVVVFDGFDGALHFADTLAAAPGIVKKGVTLFAAPVAALLRRAQPPLAPALPESAHAVFVLVAEFAESAFDEQVRACGGRVTLRQDAASVQRSRRTIVESTWNHTTLHALKVDKTLTYLQCGFDPACHVQQAQALHTRFGDEVLMHLEFIRTLEGAPNCSGLPLVRYTTDARLAEIMQIHRDHGVAIANPHVFIVEDGKQGCVNPDVVMAKRRFDPLGLLNPGKLRGWDERERIAADAAAGRISLATLPSF
jgi:FAD/FMN-containing dehydrogenase